MKSLVALAFLCHFLVACLDSHASELQIYIDLDELRKDANEYYALTSALFSAFTSQQSIAQGSFKAKYDDGPDASFDVFKFPIPYYFNKEGKLQPFVKLTYGYSRYSRWYDPYGGGSPFEEDKNRKEKLLIQTHSIGMTTGMLWKYHEYFSIEPSFGISYSHIQHNQKSIMRLTEEIIRQYPSLHRDYYDTTVDIYSITPGIRHFVQYELGTGTAGFDLHYIHQYTRSFRSKSSYADVSANSSMLHTKLEYEIPTGRSFFQRELAVKPVVVRTDFFGDIRTGMGMNHMYEYGLHVILDMEGPKGLFSRVTLGGSYMTGHEFHGWKFGLSFI